MGPRVAAYAVLVAAAVGCAGGLRRFPLRDPLWEDPDRQAFSPKPQEYYSPFAWDAANQTLFRPIARFFAVDPAGEAVNVNSMDEVPDSSWFENRLGHREVSLDEVAQGACRGTTLDPDVGPWVVTDAKPNGANPGFIIEAPDGRKWLLKFDGTIQPRRGTAADVVGSRLFYAAGYSTPCNVIVFFDRSTIEISPDAEAEDSEGRPVRMNEGHLDKIFDMAFQLPDGRYRASGSLFLDGEPIGPWRYEGTRRDDPNDVVPHEDRRELRGMYVLASWLNHFDSREQNTLSTWVATSVAGQGGRGHVEHDLIDFGDCLGSLWDYEGISRRLGHAYYLDIPYLLEDFVTLGLIPRPWDDPHYGPSGPVFAYWGVGRFVPDRWRGGYPNPAFARMSERDAAWMARIISRFDDDDLHTVIAQARMGDPSLDAELFRILRGRLDRILERWFREVSPLTDPRVVAGSGGVDLCLEDLALTAGIEEVTERRYAARAFAGEELSSTPLGPVRATGDGVCAGLPGFPGASTHTPVYLIVDLAGVARGGEDEVHPARVHLLHLGGDDYRIVGLERPQGDPAPGA